MITRRHEILCEAAEDCFAVVMNFAGFAMHDFGRADDASAERLADRLMSQANPQDRNFACKTLDQRLADAGLLRSAGAGRNYDSLWGEVFDFIEGDLVVAMDFQFLAHLA